MRPLHSRTYHFPRRYGKPHRSLDVAHFLPLLPRREIFLHRLSNPFNKEEWLMTEVRGGKDEKVSVRMSE